LEAINGDPNQYSKKLEQVSKAIRKSKLIRSENKDIILQFRDFIKIQKYQNISKTGVRRLVKTATDMAGMEAHGKSVRIRE